MIIGLLGKGGSGKSSVATQLVLWLHEQGKNVLAIDADHNMDLSYNLLGTTLPSDARYLGQSLKEIQAFVGLSNNDKYDAAFLNGTTTRFSFRENESDEFTRSHTLHVSPRLQLLTAGPQTKEVLFGQSCSHILTTPLKVYLPLLLLHENDVVVVDEKAGADGVTTGIVTGIDVAIIVCEPGLHSIKTAKQIASLLEFYKTPYVFVANKVSNQNDLEFIIKTLETNPSAKFSKELKITQEPGYSSPSWHKELSSLFELLKEKNQNDRLVRTRDKFIRNKSFTHNH